MSSPLSSCAATSWYCDINVRIDQAYSFAEEDIRKTVKKLVRRGKVEVSVTVENISGNDVIIKLDEAIAEQYVEKMLKLQDLYGFSFFKKLKI